MRGHSQERNYHLHIKVLYVLSLSALIGVLVNISLIYYLSRYVGGLRCPCTDERTPTEPTDIVRVPRQVRKYRKNASTDNAGNPGVEFYPSPQPTQITSGYVWVTSYSRVTLPVLREYCISAKEYCLENQPGVPGLPGIPGAKGEKGDGGIEGKSGKLGPRGPAGLPGQTGPVGPTGEQGIPGDPGVDGRNGLPGEPGLDGIPGLNGFDGIPGLPGIPGANGTNGATGARGETGPIGPVGLPGAKGSKGDRGDPGKPGQPGTSALIIDDKVQKKLILAPKIIDIYDRQTITVQEGDKISLPCKATGVPKPEYVWKIYTNKAIRYRNRTYVSSFDTDVMKIDPVLRNHMGTYVCIASNGITPDATKEVKLEIHFSPLIKIKTSQYWKKPGSNLQLECVVEAYPFGIFYWVYGPQLKIVYSNSRYSMSYTDDKKFTTVMTLNITGINKSDFGYDIYRCVSKNTIGEASGPFSIFEDDSSKPDFYNPNPSEHGKQPPQVEDETECPPCATCPPQRKCLTGGIFTGSVINVEKFNSSVLGKRKSECLLYEVGKSVFHRSIQLDWGSWMEDPILSSREDSHLWLMKDTAHDRRQLYTYKTVEEFKTDNFTRNYTLLYQFTGNGHLVYNNSLYYHAKNTNRIIKHNLFTNESKEFVIEDLASSSDSYLYNTNHNYIDIEADENGLWVIYAATSSNNTMVIKVNPDTFDVILKWNITVERQRVGEMFIACGILYAVESVTDLTTKIYFVFDLYNNTTRDVSIDFSNPFTQTYFIKYHFKHKAVYTWDRGNLLICPFSFTGL